MDNDTGTAFGETNGQEDSCGNNDDQNGDNSENNFLPVVAAAATDDDYNENEVVISVNVTSPDDEETLISDDLPSLGNGEIQVTACSHQEVSEANQKATQSCTDSQDSPSVTLANQEQCAFARNSTDVTYVAQSKDDTQGAESPVQTKLGKTVEIILGHTAEVKELDTLRLRLKSDPKNKFLY